MGTKAVELEAATASVNMLHSAVAAHRKRDQEAAHEQKELGNHAMHGREYGLAVAEYTMALAQVPPPHAPAHLDGPEPTELLRCVLHSNRAAAFCHLKDWKAAVADGRKAVAINDQVAKVRNRLAVALLGAGFIERAYAEFAQAIKLDDTTKDSVKGRQACLATLPLWRSIPARTRHHHRFATDMNRPMNFTRIYALSDVHFDHKENEDWAHSLDDLAFQEDVLILAGNLADSRGAVVRALTTFKQKFRRVFWVPGNHEMWLHPSETALFPDSIAKLLALYDECDAIGIDTFPAAVGQGVFVVPLLSWYSPDFDIYDPFVAPNSTVDQHCAWPMMTSTQICKYMLKLNQAHLRHLYHGTVITFSHFLPRTELVRPNHPLIKTMGCEELDDQVRAVGSQLHVFGHVSKRATQNIQGVQYVNQYHGLPDSHEANPPMIMVHDGHRLSQKLVRKGEGGAW
eukprot:NODE_274_length_1718_cov_307.357787.p2 GENE.NODE_274_length_1718_cov_307.357787~~NODE_274_length_1718_cov_307.357787.p2  ORF type:complete len:457 (+),score=138.99 NODE_274_length_1718_cov_307.357787:3-1373(+)